MLGPSGLATHRHPACSSSLATHRHSACTFTWIVAPTDRQLADGAEARAGIIALTVPSGNLHLVAVRILEEHAELHGKVIAEEVQEGTNDFLIDAHIPLVEGFKFADDIRSAT